MTDISFQDGQVLISNQLNSVQANKIDKTSGTPLVLTGTGVQLTVADTASIATLQVAGAASLGSLTVNGNGSVAQAPVNDNSLLIANTSWVNRAITNAISTGGTFVANSVAITGGTINGTSIGLTTPASGAFTALTAVTMSPNDSSTHVATTAFVVGQAATVLPIMAGTAAVGTSLLYARQDHVHPADNTRAPLASPAFTGTPTAPTPSSSDVSTTIATTAFVANAITSSGSYNAANIAVTGGTMNSVTIGGTTPAAATFSSLTVTGSMKRAVRVVTAAGAVTTTATDSIVIMNKTTGAATAVTLMNGPASGQIITVKDGKGDASTNAITIYPYSGTIDGAASFLVNVSYGSVDMVWNSAGNVWNVL